jgi:hypothetical protein
MRRRLNDRLRDAQGLEQVRIATDAAWMHRFSPVMGPLVNWQEARSLYRTAVSEEDRKEIVSATRKFEGEAAARLAEFWLERRPDAFVVIRSSNGGEGYLCSLLLDGNDEEGARADPRVAAAFAHARAAAPLREGDLLLVETWMSYTTHIAPGAMVSQISIQSLLRFFATPRLAWSFYAFSELLDTWLPFMAYIDHTPGPVAHVGSTRYQLVGHDWRKRPPDAFWDFMSERELHGGMTLPEPAVAEPPVLVLSQEEFAEAVKRALRDVTRQETLSQSVLARCRVVIECPYAREGTNRVRSALETAAESLVSSPKDEKLYSVIKATFLTPAHTQEAAAERLGLPFSTYRRHLGSAIERIVDFLWQRELHGWVGGRP